jgi:uncharacterized protein
MSLYRILSIDGGGIKGVFPASLLASLERHLPEPVGSYFDLIAGTSTGGIIALGLGLGFRAEELLGFYERHGAEIFGGNRAYLWVRHLGRAKYNPKPLEEALGRYFGDRLLGESKTRLVIPSMNLETGEVYIYKTAHHPRFINDHRVRAVDVALATSAAPTYFPAHRSPSSVPLVDGGVWANNPVGMAVVEAVGYLDWPRESLRVLSVGCTAAPFDVGARRRLGLGRLPWALKVADLFMAGQASSSLGTAYVLAGHERVTRIDRVVKEGRYGLDVHKGINSLRGLGENEARQAWPQLGPVFFSQPAEPFSPAHPRKG